jgi:hypothetical protein
MGLKSGLGSQLGIKKEVTYGTRVAPDKHYPFNSESLELAKEFIASRGLRANRLMQSKSLHVGTTRTAGGAVSLEFLNKGMGRWIDLLHGNVVAPSQIAATAAYEQTHNIGLSPPDGKSATIQVGRPDTGGTVRPFDYVGAKVITWRLTLEASGLLSCEFELDARDEDTAQTLTVATYAADAVPFNFTQNVVKVGGATIGNVRSVTIEGTNPQATDRFHLGNSGVKDEPIANDLVAVTASATLEFKDLTDHNRFKNETVVTLALEASGAVIEGAHNYEAKVTLNAAKQTSSNPTVGGPDIITTDVAFEALDDGATTPVVVYLKTTDTAL